MALHHIQLATVVLYDDFSAVGPEQIISGPSGEARGEGSCIGAAMERLHDGVFVNLPPSQPEKASSSASSASSSLIKGWIICLSADYPAAAACCGFKASTSAHCFCRQCMVNQSQTDKYPKPMSFLRLGAPFALRSMALHDEQHKRFLCAKTEAMHEKHLRDAGVNAFTPPIYATRPVF